MKKFVFILFLFALLSAKGQETHQVVVTVASNPCTVLQSSGPHIPFQIYPIPAQESLTIKSSEVITSILLLELSGKLVDSFHLSSLLYQIRTSHLKSGVYLLSIETERSSYTHKIVIHHP